MRIACLWLFTFIYVVFGINVLCDCVSVCV